MMLIGTAGYSYKDWIGPFYPKGIKQADMLEYYSKYFNFLELNSTYYHMPSLRLFESLSRKTPEGFKFAVKVFSGFTHERNLDSTYAEKFIYALEPIKQNHKLVCILAQFPYSFHCNARNVDYLKKIREWFKDLAVSVEFRNQSWVRSEVIGLLKKENLGFVCVDEPRLRGLINNIVVSTSKIAYVRMHGRNAEKWYGGKGSERYNYLYSRNELVEWIHRIKELEKNSDTTIVSFNNHPLGKAVENAKMLIDMIS